MRTFFKRLILLKIALIISLLFCNCSQKYQRVQLTGLAQGSYYSVVYYCSDGKDYSYEIDSVLKEYDMSVSIYEPNSLVSRINRGDTSVVIDKYLAENLIISKEIYEASNGVFDVTGAPLFEYWGFGPQKVDSVILMERLLDPSTADTINKLFERVGFDKVNYDSITNKLSFLTDGVSLSFNAIAQGYSVGIISKLLDSFGLNSYIVEIGGEVFTKGTKPNGDLWNVGIEKPINASMDSRIVTEVLKIKDKAVVTSGNYRNFINIDGKRYSHTINLQTGYPINNNVLSATVIHDIPAYADAWATVCMVVGLDSVQKIMSCHPEMTAYIIYGAEDGSFEVWRNDQ